MKKVLLTLVSVLFVASSASAMPIMLNPDAIFGAGTYGTTGVFDQLGILSQTTSTDYGTGAFSDVGNVKVTSLIDIDASAWAGMNSSWFLAGGWTDVTGVLVAPGVYSYQSGTLNLYALSANPNFNTVQLGADDDTGFVGTNANRVATLSLVSGSGFLVPNPYQAGDFLGSTDITWEFTWAANGFWLDGNGDPISLADLNAGEKLMAFSDMNVDKVFFGIDGKGNTLIYSDHNGSVEIGVVPEPATMVLFGTGLFGLAGAGLRKKFAA
ncbi:MAG TPA: PEP-CTERM sorting domain-containing protein [Candidatus Bathyarchaeia archaeon]|nr:PEP-CTERM sorting domain-containing protein [Candidatus Bathyarchaeia archaeon]